MRHILEFDSAEEMRSALDVLSGKADVSLPAGVQLGNEMGQSILLVARPGDDGKVLVELHPRVRPSDVPDGATLLVPGERRDLL